MSLEMEYKCPNCGSERIEPCGSFYRYEDSKGSQIYTYDCLDCGDSWSKKIIIAHLGR